MDNRQLGFVLLAHSIGAFIAMPVTGFLIAKFSSRHITRISCALFITFFALISMTPSYGVLFLPFFLMGASTGIMDVAMNSQAVVVEKLVQKPVMTFFHAMFSIGMVGGGLTGSFFTSIGDSLSFHFLSVAVFGVLVWIVAYRFLVEDEEGTPETDTVYLAWPKGPVIGLGLIAFCCMLGEGAMTDWSTAYMQNIVNTPESLSAFGLTAFAAMMTAGRLFGDRGRVQWGDRKMLYFGAISSLIGSVLIISLWHPLIVIAGFGLVGIGLANIVPIVFSLAGNLKGIAPGMGIAMSTTIGYSGFMLGPPLIGFLADTWDLQWALGSLMIFFLIMWILILTRKFENV